ncbi:hypothetical protein ACS0TY_011236 [Phlomoides rotata]
MDALFSEFTFLSDEALRDRSFDPSTIKDLMKLFEIEAYKAWANLITGMQSHGITHFDEEQNKELMREALDLMEEKREITRLKAETYKSRIKVVYNKRVTFRSFQVGDFVLRRANALKNTRKLELNWKGPYKVVQVLHGGAYKLQDM